MFEHRSTFDNRIHFYETMPDPAVSDPEHYDEPGAISRSTLNPDLATPKASLTPTGGEC
jgi:hypothetical protein